jgi:hypothetical protein
VEFEKVTGDWIALVSVYCNILVLRHAWRLLCAIVVMTIELQASVS